MLGHNLTRCYGTLVGRLRISSRYKIEVSGFIVFRLKSIIYRLKLKLLIGFDGVF